MNLELEKAIADYYKLKQKYENEINKNKSLKNATLTVKQKRDLFKKFKPKCINCKQIGGTIFSNVSGILKAVCGADEPCKLDIEINRGNFVNMRNINENLNNDLEKTKAEIIKTKLDLLFNYSNEEETIKKFNKLRPELKEIEEVFYEFQKKYLNLVDNTENREKLNDSNIKLFILKEQLKELGNKFDETGRTEIITDLVEKYINKIIPLTENIRNLKYKKVSIECSDGSVIPCPYDDVVRLVEENYTLENLQTDIGEGTGIIKNIK